MGRLLKQSAFRAMECVQQRRRNMRGRSAQGSQQTLEKHTEVALKAGRKGQWLEGPQGPGQGAEGCM